MQIRLLEPADTDALVALRIPAFGPPGTLPTEQGDHPERWGAFVDGDLAASVTRLAVDSWFGGEPVPTTAIASVAIAPEHRGQGLASRLMRHVLDHGRAEGDRVASLFATDPGIYARHGFEAAGRRRAIDVTAADLSAFVRGHRLRRATAEDLPLVRDAYSRWARTRNGPLVRAHLPRLDSWFPTATGVTLALTDDGEPLGYAAWRRGPGYEPESTWVRVLELVAADRSVRDSLLWMFGTFSTVVGTVRITAPLEDLDLPTGVPHDGLPFMIAPLDETFAVPTLDVDTLDDF